MQLQCRSPVLATGDEFDRVHRDFHASAEVNRHECGGIVQACALTAPTPQEERQ